MQLILTGEPVTAFDMERYGIVNKVVAAEQDLVTEAIKLATRIATFSAPAIGLAKQAIKTGEENAHQTSTLTEDTQPKQRHWKLA